MFNFLLLVQQYKSEKYTHLRYDLMYDHEDR